MLANLCSGIKRRAALRLHRPTKPILKPSGNKKPINLEPKMAGLMGSTKWGHQRKAVALVMTGTSIKSSRDTRNFFAQPPIFRVIRGQAR
jgi:hypothetical protein